MYYKTVTKNFLILFKAVHNFDDLFEVSFCGCKISENLGFIVYPVAHFEDVREVY